MIISIKNIFFTFFWIFLAFLTFKYLISLNLGVSIRIPHLIASISFFCYGFFLIIHKNLILSFKELFFFFFLILFVSILNHSFTSLYFYYFMFMYISMYMLFYILKYYQITPKQIALFSVILIIPHVILSYTTLHREWYGGFQIVSYSDFNTFFAMQLAIVFPFLTYIKNTFLKGFLVGLFLITLLLLGSRGALLSILIMYTYVLFRKKGIKFLFIASILFMLLFLVVYIVNPEIINFYLIKINPFSNNYDNNSDMNRLHFIIATLTHLPHWWSILIGNGIKENANIIAQYMSNLSDVNFNVEIGATVHNLFLELYSDYGIVIMLFLIIVLLRYFFKLQKYSKVDKAYTPLYVSCGIFFINYNLEPNYIHYFFLFFLFFYAYTYDYVRVTQKIKRNKNATNNQN